MAHVLLSTDSVATPSTAEPDQQQEDWSEKVLVLCIASALMVLGVSGNLLIIVTLITSKKIRLHQQGLVITLALSDLLFIGVGFPFILVAIAEGGWVLGSTVCSLQGFIICLAGLASIANLALIAFSRYWSVVHIASYRRVFVRRNIVLMMALTWIYASLMVVPGVVGWSRMHFSENIDTCMYDWSYSQSYTYSLMVCGFLLPLLVILYCYLRIFVTVLRSKARLERHHARVGVAATATQQPTASTDSKNTIRREDIRLAVQLLVLLATFLICWMPYIALAVFVDQGGTLERTYYDIAANLLAANSIVDPFVYFFSHKVLRNEAKVKLCCGFGTITVTQESSLQSVMR